MKQFALLSIALFLTIPASVFGHGTGAFYETSVGNYIADVGFSSPAPEVGESVIFDFQLRDKDTKLISGSDTPYSDVWVRIETNEGKTLLATGVHNAEFGGPRISYVFPLEGTYTVFARYENGSDSLAEVSFPLSVVPSSSSGQSLPMHVVTGIAGLIVGVAAVFFLVKKNILKA